MANQRSRLIAATIEVVAKQGYDGMTVSSVAKLAGVSKASFYEQFGGKEECFATACDFSLREAAAAVLRGEGKGGEGRERLRAGLMGLADLIIDQPDAAKLVLIDSMASTPTIRMHVCRRFGLLETLLRERLALAGERSKALTTGIVRGIEHHVRRAVGSDRPEMLRELVDPLLDWGLGFDCEEVSQAFATPCREVNRQARRVTAAKTTSDTRGLLVAAALRLAAEEGYGALSPTRIRRTAGVSRHSFDANFDDAAGCYLAAVDTELGRVFSEALRAAPAEADWAERTYALLDRLATLLAADPKLARLAFVEIVEAAPESVPWRERLITQWAESIYRGTPVDSSPSFAIAEATVAAIWGFLSDLTMTQRLHLLPNQVQRLSLFALTPALGAIGAAELIRTMRKEETRRVGRRSYERFLLSTSAT